MFESFPYLFTKEKQTKVCDFGFLKARHFTTQNALCGEVF